MTKTTTHKVLHGDCLVVLKKMIEDGVKVDSIVTDPPYHLTSITERFSKSKLSDDTDTSIRARHRSDGFARLSVGFMGKEWDGGDIAFRAEVWELCLEILKPGGYLLAFGGTRTFHRMTCAIEDSGFETRDVMMWLYSQGFPKSHDVSKAIDRKLGKEREVVGKSRRHGGGVTGNGTSFELPPVIPNITKPATPEAEKYKGYGTALKPAWEPIVVARKFLEGSIADNVLKYGTGGMNIGGCKLQYISDYDKKHQKDICKGQMTAKNGKIFGKSARSMASTLNPTGRWPANVIHDGSQEVLTEFEKYGDDISRFYYCAKASEEDRQGSKHPTIKPISLLRHLVKLVTPPNGIVLDPFAGSGTTLQAAFEEEFSAIGIEREDEYVKDIERRIANFPNRLTEFMEE